MGDQLDDFFAKKDKKKKSKSTFKAIDILEEPTVTKDKKEKKKKDTDRQYPTTKTESTTDNGDEEWKEAAEEQEPDYSGLRIKTLVIEDQTEEQDENGDCDENEANKGGMFWNKLENEPTVPPPPEDGETDWATAAETHSNSVVSGKYVPPNLRNTNTSQNLPPLRKKNAKYSAPNLSSVEDFPSLGLKGSFDAQSQGFERVKSGGRHIEESSQISNHLSLGNRFNSLAD